MAKKKQGSATAAHSKDTHEAVTKPARISTSSFMQGLLPKTFGCIIVYVVFRVSEEAMRSVYHRVVLKGNGMFEDDGMNDQTFNGASIADDSFANEQELLKVADEGLADIMRELKGDRFSEEAGQALYSLEGKRGAKQFAARCLLAFWHLHRMQLSEAIRMLDGVLSNKIYPSRVAKRSVELWRSVMDHMEKQDSAPWEDRLIEEREAFAELRRTLTLRDIGKDWLWENLFRTEGMWLIEQLPNHNSKDNSKCLYVPGLLAKEYHPSSAFAEVQELEKEYTNIMDELEPFLDNGKDFHEVGRSTAHTDSKILQKGAWTDASLFSAGVKNDVMCRKLPKLCALLEKHVPEVTKNVQGHALLSRMNPGTIIKKHHGLSNCQLTMHLGLIIPKGAGIEVNGKKRKWEKGKVLVFDDSFYHSVWHKGQEAEGPRVVLLLRGYHPEWTLEERIGLILNHNETPWTEAERWAEIEHLKTPAAMERWTERKRLFQHGPRGRPSHQDL